MKPVRLPTEADVQAYDADGVVCLRGIFDREWIDLLATGVEENLQQPGPLAKFYTPSGAPGLFFGDYCNWQRIPAYRDFAFSSPAAAIAGKLMRSEKVNFFHEHILVKEPQTENPTPWHHDQPYWVVDGWQVCSLWLPLDPVAEDVGVRFIKGSHRMGLWYRPKSFANSSDHPSEEGDTIPDYEELADAYEFLQWAVEPGDCIAFHALTIHGAPGNTHPLHRRRAVATRWTGDDARFTRRAGYMSPPFAEVDLPAGAAMDSDTFPVVLRDTGYSNPA